MEKRILKFLMRFPFAIHKNSLCLDFCPNISVAKKNYIVEICLKNIKKHCDKTKELPIVLKVCLIS